LAAAIESLATQAKVRAKMGKAGRAFVERHYRWEDNCAQMDRLYEHALAAFTDVGGYGTVASS
jgi:glycosyltransferase involved in cell wall biosynthesis